MEFRVQDEDIRAFADAPFDRLRAGRTRRGKGLTTAPRNKTITPMTTRTHRAALASALLLASSFTFAADPKFKKITLSNDFFSEGATVGDFNKDGKPDYVAGQVWVEGPDFTKKHEFAKPQKTDPHGYSKNFFAFVYDFNADGWDDVLIVGFPGEDASWYQNPGKQTSGDKDAPWQRHKVFDMVDDESPQWGDITGDGKPEIICASEGTNPQGGRLGYVTPDWSDTTKPWKFHPITPHDKRYQRFTHGLGWGDVNGDGRADLLEASGWWEQPASLDGDPVWKKHEQNFGGGGAQMYVYDVDGDGTNDVITSIHAHGYGLAWFAGKKGSDGQVTFTRHDILPEKPKEKGVGGVQFSELHAVDLYDMNGDGLKDIVTGKRWWAHGPDGDADANGPAVLYWFELKRAGNKVEWVPHQIDNDSGVGTQIVACDLNGDKLGDVVVGNKKGQFILIQEHRGTADAR